MASRVTITYIDDLTGEEFETGKGGPIQFGLEGRTYELDLTDANADQLRALLKDYIDVSRRVGTKTGTAGKRTQIRNLDLVRAWAKENGHKVAERGRVSATVLEAYDAAH